MCISCTFNELSLVLLTFLTSVTRNQIYVDKLVILVKPDNVTLESSTTENYGCNNLWVNFAYKSSKANPPVHN